MSGTTVAPAARTPAGGPRASAGWATGWRSPVGLVIIATTLLALGLRLYQFTRPGYLFGLTEYDDGAYFGSAVRLLQGTLPYRDFVLVQPPGITLLMVPSALLAKVAGTMWGIVSGRILTAVASAAGVTLLGLLIRHRGPLATLIACGTLAVFPDSVAASHTVLVEGWLVLFCLIGAVIVFDRDGLAGNRRLAWGGVAFGFAGAVEAWAIVPVLVVLALTVTRLRRAVLFLAGVAAGFCLPLLPFAALAPRGLYRSLIVAQIGPRASADRISLWVRLREMTGLSDLSPAGHANVVLSPLHLPQHRVVAAAALGLSLLVFGGFLAAGLLRRRLPGALDWFAVASTTGIVVMFLYPSQFHYHFSAFIAPFLGLAIALPVGALVQWWHERAARRAGARSRPPGPVLGRLVTVAAAVGLAAFAVVQAGAESKLVPYAGPAKIAAIARHIPPGSCVSTDSISLLVLSGHLTSDVPGCSRMLDGLGTDLALSGGLKPGTGAGQVPAVAAVWRQAFTHARFIWLTGKNGYRIAWTPMLRDYFTSHFALVPGTSSGDPLYQRKVGG